MLVRQCLECLAQDFFRRCISTALHLSRYKLLDVRWNLYRRHAFAPDFTRVLTQSAPLVGFAQGNFTTATLRGVQSRLPLNIGRDGQYSLAVNQ